MPLVPLSILHVEYVQGDRLGQLFALFSALPIFIMVAYATLFCSRRDLTTLSLVCGQLLNELLNSFLKRWFRHARPTGASFVAPEFGMPSNHAQFMGFVAASLSLWSLRCWGVARLWRSLVVCGLLSCTAVVCVARVYLNYHDAQQVVAGLVVGSVAGGVWFGFLQSVLRPRFSRIASSRIARVCLLRDLSHVNILHAEYSIVQPKLAGKRKP